MRSSTPVLVCFLAGCHMVFPHEPPGARDGAARLERSRLEERGGAGDVGAPPDLATDARGDTRPRDLLARDPSSPDLFKPDHGCSADAQCDDSDPCTVNKCVGGSCQFPAKCTLPNQTCQNGTCTCKAGYLFCGSACVQGECCNGTSRSCAYCGIEACVSRKWAGCSGQKSCNPGDNCMCEEYPTCTSGPCAGCSYHQQKVCNPDCQWGGCFG